MQSIVMERERIWAQRLADEGVLPKPCMGCK